MATRGAASFFSDSSRFDRGLIVGSPFPSFGHDNHFIPGPVAIARGVFFPLVSLFS